MSTDSTNQPPEKVELTNPDKPVVTDVKAKVDQAEEQVEMSWYMKIFTTLVYVGVALTIAWFSGADRFLMDHWLGAAIAVVALLVIVTLPTTRRWFSGTTAQRRIGLIIFSLIPMIALFVAGIFILSTTLKAIVLRMIFLIIVCSLPALMYYLFIATKKYSLFNEFVINLKQLGLINPAKVSQELIPAGLSAESEPERKNRIKTYIQKFESVYGAIPSDMGGLVIEPTDTGRSTIDARMSNVGASGFSNIFTLDTTIPVILATVLIVLGWLITFPPWQGQPTGNKPTQITTNRQGTQAATGEQALQSQASTTQNEKPLTAEEKEAAKKDEEIWLNVFTPTSSPVRFAFIGAYFFGLQLLFRRYVRRDLRASAYVAVSLRVILSVIGIWVVEEAIRAMPSAWVGAESSDESIKKLLLVMGFVIGVFPRVAWQVIQATLKRITSTIVPSLQTQLPLSDLDGLTVWHEARLEEEDIENTPNMATSDLVDLLISTRFPPDRIIDWVDQAILYTHLGPEEQAKEGESHREILRAHGIRTATALVEVYNRSEFHKDQEAFEKILPGNGRNLIRSLVDAVETNPNLKLIQTWRGLLPHSHATPMT